MVIGVNNMILYIYIYIYIFWISDNAIVTPTHQVGRILEPWLSL